MRFDVSLMRARARNIEKLSETALACARRSEDGLNIENNDGFDTVAEVRTVRGELTELLESISGELKAAAVDLKNFADEVEGVDLDNADELRRFDEEPPMPE
ncbi:hypothetical protein [Stackebrandtia nassauensis]|uniref:Uncharacterized protein n=1 Tax=Stackebrandtia nassauensis (strain DSM 44728 / CIP 108903 / NRRL B-16338 / NBRC 102104 / LLR-40K-21) TaxID=446470 RepID=D3Q8K1_STANL|nr:hypothetical protein [Stackebrandtia nassauensis]ADD44443.1 hypothetical protein Snas_4802 [Stackebrandtia nassauensis DSM 44728]